MPAKYLWRCFNCGLLNYEHKCQACFATRTQRNRIIKLGKPHTDSCMKWLKLPHDPSKPCKIVCFSTNVTDNYDIFVVYQESDNVIYKYNLHRNERKQIAATDAYEPKITLLEYNHASDKCYAVTQAPTYGYNTTHKLHFFEIDPHANSIYYHRESRFQLSCQLFWEAPFQCVTELNGIAHYIAGLCHFECDFANSHYQPRASESISGCRYLMRQDYGLIYITKSNTIMLIGGNHCGRKTKFDDIWYYKCDLKSLHPYQVSLPRALSSFGCVLTNDQKYIIIMGGEYKQQTKMVTDDIIVLNLENNTIKTSQIKCPHPGRFKSFIVPLSFKIKFIVFGFLRMYFCKRKSINKNFYDKEYDVCTCTCTCTANDVYGKARDIVGIIVTMYDISHDIHLFSECQDGHWVINANYIIDSLE